MGIDMTKITADATPSTFLSKISHYRDAATMALDMAAMRGVDAVQNTMDKLSNLNLKPQMDKMLAKPAAAVKSLTNSRAIGALMQMSR